MHRALNAHLCVLKAACLDRPHPRIQVHAGSLGLDAAVVAAVTQELAMREALSVASARQMLVSPLAMAEAAGLQPPVAWR
jgi:hypothetical protein